MAVAVLALSWSSQIWELLVYRFISGIGAAMIVMPLNAYLADATQSGERGRIIALFGGINRIGQFAGPAVGGLVATAFGITAPFFLFSTLCLIAIIPTVFFVKASPKQHSSKHAHSYTQLFAILKDYKRIFLTAGTGMLFAQMIRAGRQVIIPLFGSDVLGLSLSAVGLIMSISSAIDMSLFYPAGIIMDRWGRKFAIVPSFILQGLGMALIPLATGFGSLLIFASLIGFGNGISSGTMMTLGTDLAPKDALGEFLGVWRFIGDAGGSAGPLAVGAVAGVLSLGASALVLAGIGWASATVFAFGVPETLKRQHTAQT
jgi:MFS family permease